nr:OmpA family protein [Hyphomicrobium sp.]
RSLTNQVAEQIDANSGPSGKSALKFVTALVLLPLIGWFAWSWYTDYVIATTKSAAERIVAADPAMLGYPVRVTVGNWGRDLSISGLTPSLRAKSRIVADLANNFPKIAIDDKLTVVAGSDVVIPDVSPELARVRGEMAVALTDVAHAAVTRANRRAATRLNQAITDLKGAAGQSSGDPMLAGLARIATDLETTRDQLASASTSADAEHATNTYGALARQLNSAADEILKAIGAPSQSNSNVTPPDDTTGEHIETAVEHTAAAAERVAALASTVATANALRPPVPAPAPPPPAVRITVPAEPTPRETLDAWTRSHAIFFNADLDYRNADQTQRWLNELANLLKATPMLLRIVGYTDETGTSGRNVTLAQERAAKVRNDLLALGISQDKLVTVGRASALDLSDVRGTGTPNRRVQFELGFEDEAPQ